MIVPTRPADVAAVVDHYTELDPFYREVWGEHVHHGLWVTGRESPAAAAEQLVIHLAEQAGVRPGHDVCDIGSGYGATARLLARRYGARVTALTVVPAQHAHAVGVDPGADNPRYLLRDWHANDLPTASFDVALAVESTEHFTDKPRAFAEAHRVLRPGGRLAVCAWLAAEQPRAWERRHLLEPICSEGRMSGMGSESEYRALLEGAGFAVERAEDVSRRVRRTWAVCLRRAAARLGTDARYRRFMASRASRNRVFLLTLARIWAAYHTGAMRYVVFVARR